MSDLLTCPFCGGALVWSDTYSEYHHPVAKCILSGHKFKKGMIGQWNRRALPAVQPDADELVGHMTKLIAAGLDRIEALTAERDEALWQAECAKDTLSAWFDRRKLGHEAVDQAVVDAASGYLRTCRVGGMSIKQSDLILGVVQGMARLGLFADLFARAALKGEAP